MSHLSISDAVILILAELGKYLLQDNAVQFTFHNCLFHTLYIEFQTLRQNTKQKPMKSFTQLFARQINKMFSPSWRRALPLLTTVVLASMSQPTFAQNDPIVIMQTTKGRIVIRVFRNMVPYTANNFLDLVSRGYYDGKSFHRVEGWVVQGGCPYGNGQGNYTDPDTGRERFIRLETNRNLNHNSAGVVAMARGQSPDSASCQFYILKKPMSQLNGKYAVFGGVVDGLNNIYRIAPGDRIISAQIAGGQQQRAANREASEPAATTPTEPAASGESKEATGASGF